MSFRGVRGKGLRTLLLGPFALLARVPAARSRSSGAGCPTSCWASAASRRFPAGSWARRRASRWCCTTRNAVAGLATRVLAYGADRILLGFPQALRGRHAKRGRMGRQSAARCDLRAAAARAALRRAHGSAAPAGRRRQPRRAGVERAACRRRSRSSPPRSAPRDRASGRRAAHRGVARGAMRAAWRRRRMRRLHRRHGGALRVGGLRDLPRRRDDGCRARGGRPGRDRRAAAGRHRRRAERQRAIPGRRGRGAEGAAAATSRRNASPSCLRRHRSRRARWRWRRRAHALGKRDAAERVADVCVALGTPR